MKQSTNISLVSTGCFLIRNKPEHTDTSMLWPLPQEQRFYNMLGHAGGLVT